MEEQILQQLKLLNSYVFNINIVVCFWVGADVCQKWYGKK